MEQMNERVNQSVARLIPIEQRGPELDALSSFAMESDEFEDGDVLCSGLEELSRLLKRLDDDYQSGQYDRLEARARSIVMLADRLGLRQVGQVAADVVYCVDGPDEIALSATLSRLMRLVTQALDHAAGPMTAF
ncbi:hypothetical protein L0666_12715 [Octadecabacter sp. CECT 8868]|uniref:hypothetical protein n=1 Tax=Octadecabacter algicola TaxID=2909342 RepID=UPI001F41C3A5|nr:hypothetical protein [Octadecabacter algicola]MCF2905853.1 hypothetical protein [Octadecabacter algicola]